MSSKQSVIVMILGLLGTPFLVGPSVARAQERPHVTLEQIWAALRERQEQVRTARVSWTYEFSRSEYAMADLLVQSGGDPKQAADLTFPKHTSRLSLAGDKVRYETVIPSFAAANAGGPVPGISAFDGTEQQFFSAKGRDRFPSGSLKPRDGFQEWAGIHILPLTFALRPLRPELFGPEPGEWQIVEKPVVVGGRQCILLRKLYPIDPELEPPGQRAEQAYLDPEMGFRLLRFTTTIDDRITVRVDASYERAGAYDWIPSSWSSAMYGAVTGKLGQSSRNNLVDVVLNVPIPEDEFRIKFPPGTRVISGPTPYEFQIFVAQKDGSLVPASPRVQIQTQNSGGWAPWSSSWPMILGGILVLALALVWALRRRYA